MHNNPSSNSCFPIQTPWSNILYTSHPHT